MAFDPWAQTNQGLSNLTNTLGTLAQLKRQDQQYADEAPLRSLQMQQAQQGVEQQGLTLANLKGQQGAMIGRYGTGAEADPLAGAYTAQAKEQEAAEQQKAQREKQKFAFDAFTKVQDAVKNRLIDPAKAGDFYHTQMKLAGLDLDGAGVKMEFMDRGSYFSGPITPEALFMVNGKPTPYGGNGTIEKARIVGQDPQSGKPIFEMDEHTNFKPAEVKEATETWGEPYEANVGGKRAMVQKSSRGQVKPVIQDTSTTIKVQTGGAPQGKPPAGYRWKGDGTLEAIPGGPAEAKAEAANQAKEKAKGAYDASIAVVDKLLSHPGRKTATGLSSALDPRNYVPGTNAYDFHKELESFDAVLFLSNIEKMKGMGALSNAEGAKVSAAAGAIKPGMSEKAFEANLNIIKTELAKAKTRIESTQQAAPAQPKQGQAKKGGGYSDLLNKYKR